MLTYVFLQEDAPSMSLSRVFALNAPEWPYMLIGCICSILNGGVQPAFAIVFAEIMGVSHENPTTQNLVSRLYLCVLLPGFCQG